MRLMSLAASSKLTKDNVYSILKFIRYLGDNYISSKDFINSIRGAKWLRTCRGDMTPCNSVLCSYEWNAAKEISDIPFVDQDYYGRELVSFKKELELLGVVVNFGESCYKLVSDNFKSSSSFTKVLLKCIQKLNSSDELVQALKSKKCVKTNLGYRCPSECFLLNPKSEWGGLLQVFRSFPVLDEKFYGTSIFSMLNELKKIGVMVDFEDASKEFTLTFNLQASPSSITKETVFLFLSCYRNLKKMKVKFPSELKNCIRQEKWIRTKLGDYRSPKDCILFGKDWEAITPIAVLPFIDDNDNFYGSGIHSYTEELKQLGVTTNFKDGAKFVASGLVLPQDSSIITPVNVYTLLDSVKKLEEIPAKFLEKLSKKKWLKTHFGYKRPVECLLYDRAWVPFLKQSDGPFIDEEFYGARIGSYDKELNLIGVITDDFTGCKLLASCLESYTSFESINRVYSFLIEFKWKPADEDNKKIWIPKGTDDGEWVDAQDCVLHDKNNLFGQQLYVLDKLNYEENIQYFFADVYSVKANPSVDDYCNLWKKWKGGGYQVTYTQYRTFWEFVAKNFNTLTEETFIKSFSQLPVLDPISDEICLFDKCDVLIGDDLYLMDLFQTSAPPMFVWYPPSTLKSQTRTKLVEIYSKLGVRTLSESVQKYISDVDQVGVEPINLKEKVIKRGLFKLILGYLADPNLKLEADKRHEAVSRLLAIEAFETAEPMRVIYRLTFSNGDYVKVEAKRMIRWDKQNSKFFMQKMDRSSSGYKNVIEYACQIAKVIADGVLRENEELVPHLSQLIRLGFLVDFDDEAIEFLMKNENLQIFPEDQTFLSSTFSSK